MTNKQCYYRDTLCLIKDSEIRTHIAICDIDYTKCPIYQDIHRNVLELIESGKLEEIMSDEECLF